MLLIARSNSTATVIMPSHLPMFCGVVFSPSVAGLDDRQHQARYIHHQQHLPHQTVIFPRQATLVQLCMQNSYKRMRGALREYAPACCPKANERVELCVSVRQRMQKQTTYSHALLCLRPACLLFVVDVMCVCVVAVAAVVVVVVNEGRTERDGRLEVSKKRQSVVGGGGATRNNTCAFTLVAVGVCVCVGGWERGRNGMSDQ